MSSNIFSYILLVFVWNVWWCTVSNFYHARDISITYCSGGGFLFVCLSCWVPTYAYSWINIYRGWTNNGNTRQYRNKTVCVGLHWKKISCIVIFLFCLCCVMPVLMQYRLCLVTVCTKVMQNGKFTRFSMRTDCWCTFSWSICNQTSLFIRCIQSSSFQGYDDIHK